jgi:hypothetical protein
MTPAQESAIIQFFSAVSLLEESGVIRSSRYLGDLGEFLCREELGIELSPHLRQTGHDGVDGEEQVQIKFSNSTAGNNIKVGNPENYDALIIVLGPRSKLREADHMPAEFRFYRFTKAEVLTWRTEGNNYFCAKERLASCLAKKILSTKSGVRCTCGEAAS